VPGTLAGTAGEPTLGGPEVMMGEKDVGDDERESSWPSRRVGMSFSLATADFVAYLVIQPRLRW
jgi:hypothetical protein